MRRWMKTHKKVWQNLNLLLRVVQLLASQSTGVHWYGPGPTGDERRPPGSSESGGGGCVDVPGKGWGRPGNRGNEPPPSPSPHLSTLPPSSWSSWSRLCSLSYTLDPWSWSSSLQLFKPPDPHSPGHAEDPEFLWGHYVSRAKPWEWTSNNVQACRSHLSPPSSPLI